MKITVLIFCLLGPWATAHGAKTAAWKESIEQKIDRLIQSSGVKRKHLGLVVSYGENGNHQDLYRLNDTKKLIPASLSKIVTAGAALEKLPIGHKFVTELKSPGKIENGTLKGDLYLVGGGDPGFISESMWYLVNELMRSGVQVIQGDLIVDDTRFDNVRFDPGRDPSRVDRAYDAPIGAMTFNWSSVNVFVRPGLKRGDPARVFIDPQNQYIKLVNKAKTGRKGSGKSIKVSRTKGAQPPKGLYKGDVITVRGSIAEGHDEIVKYKSITLPEYWAGFNLKSFLQQRGIEISGKVRTGKTPTKAQSLADADSRPIGSLVMDMMKFSNNYIAEILTKNLAVEVNSKSGVSSKPATMEAGMGVLHSYLQEKGFKKSNYSMVNPSGLSRSNRFRPTDLHKLLVSIKKSFRVFPEALSALPIGGVDGTLEKMLKNTPAVGRVRAKTGLLNGVTGLSGYAAGRDGQSFVFVFLYNGPHRKTFTARKLFADLAVGLVE